MAKSKGVSHGGSRPEDKGKGKEVKPRPEAKGPEAAFKIKDVTPKAKNAAPSQAIKKTLIQLRHSLGSFSFTLFPFLLFIIIFLYLLFLFCNGYLPLFMMYLSFV